MAEFSRIQVTPAEEEDIVIMAGAVADPSDAHPADGPSMEEAVHEEEVVSASADALEEAVPTASRSEKGYEETTLADLQRGSMSGMQKAIIALAIVAVVAFIIWYVLLR